MNQYRNFGGPVRTLDLQVLLDPIKKELNLPAAVVVVEFGHLRSEKVKAVGEKYIFFPGLKITIMQPTEQFRIGCLAWRGT